ncbi:hypothetical protein UM776_12895 [Staphylococcus aureus]|nr:hypothetical protein QQG27_04360 [Staphylococcus aureus]WRN20707.1 hypothetical protein UM484_10755 [Staphylococcus aureus]WRN26422.1 hypothetical protein UM776_12895 [Staphylococcus aureus]
MKWYAKLKQCETSSDYSNQWRI